MTTPKAEPMSDEQLQIKAESLARNIARGTSTFEGIVILAKRYAASQQPTPAVPDEVKGLLISLTFQNPYSGKTLRAHIEAQANLLALTRMEADGAGSMMLSLQQDCIALQKAVTAKDKALNMVAEADEREDISEIDMDVIYKAIDYPLAPSPAEVKS